MNLSPGLVLIKKDFKGHGKPTILRVCEQDCEREIFIRLERQDGTTLIMHKWTIPKFYEIAANGKQSELFSKPKSIVDVYRSKHLKGQFD